MGTSRLRLALGVALTAVLAVSLGGAALADNGGSRAALSNRTDAYTRDQVGDNGTESNPSTVPVWASPDIRVCQTALGCAADQPLIVGSTAYIFVTLNNAGPYGSGPSSGTLNVYSTLLGGAATWSSQFTQFGSVAVTAYPGVTTVTVPWVNVPDDGPLPGAHFCLLTRWVSPTDPMTSEGPNAIANTIANNNISWHNVDPINVSVGNVGTQSPFHLGNVTATATLNDLAFGQPGRRLETVGGTIIVDLGPALFQRWQQNGAKGTAIRAIGGTRIQVLDPGKARISGVTVNPGERPQVALTFTATQAASEIIPITVTQFGPGKAGAAPTDIGGVEYRLTVGRG
ncbi:hypothetical protein AB0M43_00325 [Longispora sp. NPDC051575]|uniref:hypothetical protein n=1 Tax=Longispora sp. NPDC051575 TaxID=3154943 RepID=UPI00344A02E6